MAATQFLRGKNRNGKIFLFFVLRDYMCWRKKPKYIKYRVTHRGEYWNLVYLYLICLDFSLTQKTRNSFTFNSDNYTTNQRLPAFFKFSLFHINITINKPQGFTEILLLYFIYSLICCIRNTLCWMLVLIAPSKGLLLLIFWSIMFNNK